jgi:hypothetical protein
MGTEGVLNGGAPQGTPAGPEYSMGVLLKVPLPDLGDDVVLLPPALVEHREEIALPTSRGGLHRGTREGMRTPGFRARSTKAGVPACTCVLCVFTENDSSKPKKWKLTHTHAHVHPRAPHKYTNTIRRGEPELTTKHNTQTHKRKQTRKAPLGERPNLRAMLRNAVTSTVSRWRFISEYLRRSSSW